MADTHAAILFTLHLEDARMTGAISHDPHDAGGATRYGIAQRWHPELVPLGFFTTMNATTALSIALTVYATQYVRKLMLDQIGDQAIANALLASAVNIGPVIAVELLQAAVGVKADGCMGPTSVDEINHRAGETLLDAFIAAQIAHYQQIVAGRPEQSRYLAGWINRANAAKSVAV